MANNGLGSYEIPPIYVSESGYDDMGEVLQKLEVNYQGIDQANLPAMDDGVLMINCHTKWRDDAIGTLGKALDAAVDSSSLESFIKDTFSNDSITDSLDTFIRNGGAAIISDYAGELLTTFTASAFDTSTQTQTVTTSVDDPELVELLGKQQIEIEFDLGGWYKPKTIPQGSTSLLRDSTTGDILAYKFSHGRGDIVYTAFHNHAQATEVEQALLKLLLMIPIAETTGTNLKDTYTTITGETIQSGDTVIQDSSESSTATAPRPGSTASSRSVTVKLDIAGGGVITEELASGQRVRFGRDDFIEHVAEGQRQYISGTHFALGYQRNGTLKIQDLNSSNGTQLNGRELSNGESQPLSGGAEVDLADGVASAVIRIS
ncbi:hypothetical protein B9H04_06870 [Halorubrum ezzemoulense DSM 17463]|uniref:FHA domain-containing protein n=1 Tax=Halorubrum ezzemoulense DSM 17463 TaxID=1121945 RepID=A0A1X4H8N4_HALEZ|nr:FHA domain-containing protein [Halorubrum ezzemoulense]OSP08280.1 hypothetical protein B9H04_06870 [Halorubrum ezzemoulense DSM 17463]